MSIWNNIWNRNFKGFFLVSSAKRNALFKSKTLTHAVTLMETKIISYYQSCVSQIQGKMERGMNVLYLTLDLTDILYILEQLD